ncbi:MAG: C4-dicarboxylate ABC transporter substrate-binding protein [Proteobacteria bacterium]|nr:C4-dicarboxylate ABC transporter substrate-binding protein [Pseudomonadota bacterium]
MRFKKLPIVVEILCLALVVSVLPFSGASSAQEVIKLKAANFFPPPALQSKYLEDFIADLEARTNGRVKVSYFAGGSLLKAPRIYEGVVTGIADIGLAHIEYTPGRFPITGACEMPLGYPSAWVANQVANDFYNNLKPKEWDDVHVLWMHSSNPSVMITKKPVRKLEDLKGMTIRAPGIVGYTISALGGTPAPTPMMEVYDAMAKGVIDGVNTPFETLKTFRFAEVVGYTTASWQTGNVYTFYVVMNKSKYQKLPPDIKGILDELAGEYKERFALMWNAIDFYGKEFAQEKGVEIIELPEYEAARWVKAAAPVIEDYVKDMVGKGHSEAEVRGWLKFIRERMEYWTAKQLQLSIKSPTGPPQMRP